MGVPLRVRLSGSPLRSRTPLRCAPPPYGRCPSYPLRNITNARPHPTTDRHADFKTQQNNIVRILRAMQVNKRLWKIWLAIAGVAIIAISMLYTNFLVNKLKEEERKKVEIWKTALIKFNESNNEDDLTLLADISSSNSTIPIILVNEKGEISESRNFRDTSKAYLEKVLRNIRQKGPPPIKGGMGYAHEIYYTNSHILTLLRYLPFLQFLLISAFILAGYIGFSAARKAEQNRVWVGMAKETAHQLGTPISAIIGWIETLKMSENQNSENTEIILELEKDVAKLELIADRFSKIGSKPELSLQDILPHLQKDIDYMDKRSSKQINFDLQTNQAKLIAAINPPLFNWVIENLLRNAVDAVGQKGNITIRTYKKADKAIVEIIDNGPGIPTNKHKTIFKPGYSTKKRGWGLGLSLAKRIIQEYHNGKIYVKTSDPNNQTVFALELNTKT